MRFWCVITSALLLTTPSKAGTPSIGEIVGNAKIGDLVELQGTVTLKGQWLVLLHDGTSGVTVYDTYRRDFAQTGDVIRICAQVEERKGNKWVRITHHEKIGENFSLADPIQLTVSGFRDAKNTDYRPISVSGVAIDAFRDEFDPAYVCLLLAPLDAPLTVFVNDQDKTIDVKKLIDAEVRILGVASENSSSRPYLGKYLHANYAENLELVRAPMENPYDVPPLLYDTNTDSFRLDPTGHRQRLSGTVMATSGKSFLFLRTSDGLNLRVHLNADALCPRTGDAVTVSGLATHDIFFTKIIHAFCRVDGTAVMSTEQPQDVSPHALLADDKDQLKLRHAMDGRLIRLSGIVVNNTVRQNRANSFVLACGSDTVEVEIQDAEPPGIGSEIETTGICRFIAADDPEPTGIPRLKSFAVLTRTPADIKILKDAPWWTPFRAIVATSFLLLLILAGFIWNLILQKLIARKGRELARESLAHLKAELRTDERMALAVELHDTIAQNLTGVSMQLEGVDEAHRIGSSQLGALIGKARHTLDACCVELRNCLWDLRNDAFDSDDISATVHKAIAPHLKCASADVALDLARSRISDSTLHALLSIIRELVINAVKHAHATHIDIRGEINREALKISVKDNGGGFNPANRPGPAEGHFGLLGIQERLDRIGGMMDITSSPGNGATFTITIES